jgi:hypothetical protein
MPFFVEANSGEDLYRELARQDSANPLFTWKHAQAMREAGVNPCVLGIRDGRRLTCGSSAILRKGRLNRSLEILSLPDIDNGEAFWDGLLRHCRSARITRLELGSWASHRAEIPQLPGEISRRKRWEFVIDLPGRDLLAALGSNHVRNVRKAEKNGVMLVRTAEIRASEELARLPRASMERRAGRGEIVPKEIALQESMALLRTGAAELFQAVRDGRVLSSTVVMRAEKGGYMNIAGTDAEGMQVGSSHFLNYHIAKALQGEGCDVYNLGGADDLNSGLANYKVHFGARVVPLETAEFQFGNRLHNLVGTVVAMMRPRNDR